MAMLGQISPRTLRAGALVAALTLLAAGGIAGADEPIAENADQDTVSRVLEIPQTCTRDGVVTSCDESGANTGQVPNLGARDGDESADPTTTAEAGPGGGDDYNLPELSPDWRSLDDYQNQALEEAPIYLSSGAYRFQPPSYAMPPVTPASTGLTPGWTRPPFGTGPWMIPPSAMMRPAPAPLLVPRTPFSLH